MILAFVFAIMVALVLGGLLATGKTGPGAGAVFTPGERGLLIASPIPSLVMMVLPWALHLPPNSRTAGRVVWLSLGLSAVTIAAGWTMARSARRSAQDAKFRKLVVATVISGIPLVLALLLVALEAITGGWSP